MTKKDTEYIKVKIEGIFNLQNSAEEFNLTSAELVSFHNQFCTIHEVLPESLPKHVEYIYLPSKIFLERDKKLLKSSELIVPKNQNKKTYGVKVSFLPKKLTIHYKINVNRTEHYLQLIKEKTFINNQEIEQTIEQLFEKAEQVLYPLQISQSDKGGIERIVNKDEIKKRWQEDCRPKIAEYYRSDTSDQILKKLDFLFNILSNKRDFLERNLFYNLYFLPVYQNYHQFTKQDKLQIYFSTISKEINFDIEYTLNKEFTIENKIALKISGIEQENIFNSRSEKGKLDFLYKFDKETKEIFSITGFAEIIYENKTYKIEFELFDLENNSLI